MRTWLIPFSHYHLRTLKLMQPLADLLAVLNAPEWPAAALLLTRGLIAMGGAAGLKSANQPVRQVRAETQLQPKGAVLSLCDKGGQRLFGSFTELLKAAEGRPSRHPVPICSCA